MIVDILSLAGVVFDDFSTPTDMPGGGNQANVVHKLPGGSRVINTLGPDDADVTWSGAFFGNDAYATALLLDSIRAAGQVVPLIWGGQYRDVIVSRFTYKVRRMPTWVLYSVTCIVANNPMQSNDSALPSSTPDEMINADLSSATDAANGVVTDDTSSLTGNFA